MGAYTPLPWLPEGFVGEVVERVARPAVDEMRRRGTPFVGVLYCGIALTSRGLRVIEFNARFGDPETQAILPRVVPPLAPLLLAAAEGRLAEAAASLGIDGPVMPATADAVVAIVLAGRDYPAAPAVGDRITGLEAAAGAGALVFHAGTRATDGGGWQTDGGRILAVVGRGRDLAAARAAAEEAADHVAFPGAVRRRDIGAAPLPAGEPGRP
jgi:phosphoribosylamine--glycine ligase